MMRDSTLMHPALALRPHQLNEFETLGKLDCLGQVKLYLQA